MTSIGGIAKGCQALLSAFRLGTATKTVRVPIGSEYWHGM